MSNAEAFSLFPQLCGVCHTFRLFMVALLPTLDPCGSVYFMSQHPSKQRV